MLAGMKKHLQPNEGFTFIELMVAIVIVGVLSVAGMASYQSSLISSRDARRKMDLEQLRNAMEIYRSNSPNSMYPTLTPGLTLMQAPVQYIRVPRDPKTNQPYGYWITGTTDYTLGTILEGTPNPTCTLVSPVCRNAAGNPARCSYCIGPYGPN
jgi:general secretion pathway protein G